MVDRSDRRIHPRIDARIRVQFKTGKEFIDSYSENISKGGIYLETSAAPDPNAVLEVVLDLPLALQAPDLKQITLRGRIVRTITSSEDKKTTHKVAIQFIEMTPQIQTKLDMMYDDLKKTYPPTK